MEDSVEYLAPRVAIGVCLLGLICIYTIYYLVFNVTRPRVVCRDARRVRELRRHCPALFERYWPTFWALQGHVQSIVRLLTQIAPSVESLGCRREKIFMKDGGHVCLDWFNEGASWGEEKRDNGDPIVLILPGVTGSSKETYARQWIDDCRRLGYRCVVFNYRGCGNSKISTPKLFSLGDVSDLTEVAEHLHTHNPSSLIVSVGVSMASIQLVRYVAECKRQARPCRISAILIFSVIWNLSRTDKSLHQNFFNNHVLSRFLTRRYTNLIKENRRVFQESEGRNECPFDYKKAIQSRNLRELNGSCIVPSFGYENDPMKQSHSPCENVGELNVPVIAVNAADDPFCPADAIPEAVARGNPNLILVTTRRGGHIGFMQGPLPFYKTYMNRLLTQFLVAVLQHNCLSLSSTPPASEDGSSCQLTNESDLETQALLA